MTSGCCEAFSHVAASGSYLVNPRLDESGRVNNPGGTVLPLSPLLSVTHKDGRSIK